MADPSTSSTESEQIERDAYAWVQRRHDGLTAPEEAEFQAWLEADLRHREAYTLFQAGWDRFEPMAEEIALREAAQIDVTLAAPSNALERPSTRWWQRRLLQPMLSYAAIAACLTAALVLWSVNNRPAAPLAIPALCEQRVLPDGSIIELNRNAAVSVDYSGAERRVRLLRGEANFQVAKNKDRPFIVEAGGVHVRAVGTVFNVRFDPAAVEVVVTEGRVAVVNGRGSAHARSSEIEDRSSNAPGSATLPSHLSPSNSDLRSPISEFLLEAGQKATVALVAANPAPDVVTLAPAQMEEELLWQPKILDFDNATLAEIVAEFNRRNPVHLIIDHDSTAERRMTANFRSDNMEGFVRLLESDFGIKAERVGEREIRLRRK